MLYPSKPRPGDRVAILSPSAGLPGLFPDVFELGLRRLRDEFGLEPVEYPTTRTMNADPRDRARDINAAFADPSIRAIMASIGGDDQITVIGHLDGELIRADPKPFFGYSDNTNLLNYLFHQGVVGYHGGSVMVHLGRGGSLQPVSARSLRAALFTSDWYALSPAEAYTDEHGDWADLANLEVEPELMPGEGWSWHGPRRAVEGRLWGGCLEVVSWILQAGRVAENEAFTGGVLVLETSEEMPSAAEVGYLLRSMGERGLLERFAAILIGRPKAWDSETRQDLAARRAYAADQRAAVLGAVSVYNPDAVLVFDLDIGHTDPQLILPIGGLARVDGIERRITVRY
ncbi:muramoyltetrapeptide carboxypeptidase LdcA involved in peptidoglycan recycling [Allocatelliglobosispora scoriae]|uniref:Muramoyltetrapeptide carboxypeptidase LdcA involved in peptidoglycan recycling n=1 Tax=Allocatelliglobosispora scoriae TaxID=643052 RepID=A0A841BSE6_9ACTN|nr:S66 peptidase family protein [Allocatelliglobosispora scoriae]MBB5869731.1 muramoyltetrapeptide carboxypeptidase LdcA involved in peptidoglycan recycling [Allocatelliglobosispora scoriae]